MTVAHEWALIAVVLGFSLAQAVLLIRLVRSQVDAFTAEIDDVCAKIDEVAAKVDKIRRWLDSRDA